MKTILTTILFLLIFSKSIYSQPWSLQNSGTINKLNSISASQSYYAYVCGNNGTVLKTTNGGTNWINVSGNGIPLTLNLSSIFSHKVTTYTPISNDIRYAFVTGTDNSGSYIYMTSNGGTNWGLVHTVTGTGAKLNAIWFLDTLRGFAEGEPVAGRWSFWKTTNRGVNWDSVGLYLNGQNYSGFTNNISGHMQYYDSAIYVGANYNGTESRILRTYNLGQSWTIINPGKNRPMTSLFFLRNNYYNEFGLIGGNKYFGRTSNSGNNWTFYDSLSFNSTLVCMVEEGGYSGPSFIVKTDSLGKQTIYWGWGNWLNLEMSGLRGMTHMQGMDWKMWLVGDSGKIYNRLVLYPNIKKIGNEIPENFSLSQNYPNPFNPSTNIRYQITNNILVTLKVYDILGKEVAVLVNEKQTPGTYEVQFPNVQSANVQLPSGVYFYSLFADGNLIVTKKMLLIK